MKWMELAGYRQYIAENQFKKPQLDLDAMILLYLEEIN
jgi:hypothetical protein